MVVWSERLRVYEGLKLYESYFVFLTMWVVGFSGGRDTG